MNGDWWIRLVPVTWDYRSARYAYWNAWMTGTISVVFLIVALFSEGTFAVGGVIFALLSGGWVWNYRRRVERDARD